MKTVVVTGSFNNIQSRDIRFLEEAATIGPLTILLWSDEAYQQVKGRKPEFPQKERQYFLESVRYVQKVILADGMVYPDEIPQVDGVNRMFGLCLKTKILFRNGIIVPLVGSSISL